MRKATFEELLDKLRRFDKIQTMKATVELRLTAVNADSTRVQEFRDAPGFILARRPAEILTIALVPVVRSMAFQMASNGESFQVSLPSKRRFFVGDAKSEQHSENRLENIRPQHILEALMLRSPRADEMAALENATDGSMFYQIISFIRAEEKQRARITRKFWFRRDTLELERMQVLDDHGDTATLAQYEQWMEENSLPYPAVVTVNRPSDGYSVRISIQQPGLNETVSEGSFVLQAPDGVPVEKIGEAENKQAKASSEARPE